MIAVSTASRGDIENLGLTPSCASRYSRKSPRLSSFEVWRSAVHCGRLGQTAVHLWNIAVIFQKPRSSAVSSWFFFPWVCGEVVSVRVYRVRERRLLNARTQVQTGTDTKREKWETSERERESAAKRAQTDPGLSWPEKKTNDNAHQSSQISSVEFK